MTRLVTYAHTMRVKEAALFPGLSPTPGVHGMRASQTMKGFAPLVPQKKTRSFSESKQVSSVQVHGWAPGIILQPNW
jgi:hypothetical protein